MLRYSMLIQWADTENVYIVTFPDVPGYQAQGDTYEEAARSGREVLEQLIESGEPIPEKPVQQVLEQKAEESKAIEVEDKEAQRQREQEKHGNYIAWLDRENERMRDERKGVGYSKFYAQWIDDHNGNGDGMEDAWKQTDTYKAKQEERRQRYR
jgi:predicted RNase H-like HicB family nuclease